MSGLPIEAGFAVLREWRSTDLDALVSEANNRAVWRNLTDDFPHPYFRTDGEWWISACREQRPPRDLVISVGDDLAGVCGMTPGEGVTKHVGLVGYWIGERHWGRGVATAALKAFLDYAWDTFPVTRLEARVFAWNPASARVLEKNGFSLEGVRRNAIRKDGQTVDELVFGLLRSEESKP